MAKLCSKDPHPASALSVLSNDAVRWYAAYTQPRHEKTVDRHLRAKELETYLPLQRQVRCWNGRRAEVESPLFAGYVFVRLRLSERRKALEHPSVISFVSFAGRPAPLGDDEIDALRNAITQRKAEPYPYLSAGKRVRIVFGPLAGLEGVVLRANGKKTRMVVSVEFLQRSIAVDLEPGDLRAAA
jgi:transcription antitermination factor NusG